MHGSLPKLHKQHIHFYLDCPKGNFASRIIVAHSSHSPFDWPCKAMKLRNGFQAMLTTAYILTIPSSQTLCETLFTCAIFDDISMTDKLVCDAKKDNHVCPLAEDICTEYKV